ncbi:MAG: hypothetical protein GQ532_01960, partial [Methylomarinum sp.]|nr:hypothetical protein [Methylomarinum sp.]
MTSTAIFRQILSAIVAMSLLLVLFYITYKKSPEFENQLSVLSKQVSTLNLQINQSIFLHQFGIEKNNDQLTRLVLKLAENQQQLKHVKKTIQALNNDSIIQLLDLLEQQLTEKNQLIEDYKSHHAIYNNSLYFFQKLLKKTSSNPILDASIKIQAHRLQSALFQNIHQNTPLSSVLVNNNIATLQKTSATVLSNNDPQLESLIQHAKLLLSYGNDAKESVIKITNPQTVFLTERLEDAITQHYLLEHKKS